MKLVLPVICLGLMLTACGGTGGPAVSGSADESARSESGLSSLWERVRGSSVEQSKTIEMPAFAIIADAFTDDAMKRRADGLMVRQMLMARDGNQPPDTVIAQVDHLTDNLKHAGSPAQTRGEAVEHFTLGLPILVAIAPLRGWEVNVIDDRDMRKTFSDPIFKNSPAMAGEAYNPAEHAAYMHMLAVSASFANDVFAEIAAKMQGTTISDPDAAKARVMEIYRSLPAAALHAKLAELSGRADNAHYSTDLTGSGNIRFVADGLGTFVGDTRGMNWTKSGATWFGDSHINGSTTNFRLAAATSLSRREAQTGTTGNTSGSSVTGSSSINGGK